MTESQGPASKPAVVSREYVLRMLTRIFGYWWPADPVPAWFANLEKMGGARRRICPEHVLPALLDYLEGKGVVVRNGEPYELPEKPDSLAACPEDAQRSLHEAITNHATSAACPRLLKHVIPAPPPGGNAAPSPSGSASTPWSNCSSSPSRPDYKKEIARLIWDRASHLQELADFGPHAEMIFDWVIKELQDPLPPPQTAEDRQGRERERVRHFKERAAARRKQIDETIDAADVPRLADLWHMAAKRLCEPTGNPIDDDLHVLWRCSQRLLVEATSLQKTCPALARMRGATIDLPPNVNHARECFASEPTLVSVRTRAAAEIAKLQAAWELQSQRRGEAAPGVGAKPSVFGKSAGAAPTQPASGQAVSEVGVSATAATPQPPQNPVEAAPPMRQGSSVLMPNQLPAMVLVTLHEMGREMRKSVLKALPDVRKSDRRNLSNLLTPNGDLARRDFIESIGHTVRLTAKGRAEAAAQQQLGTQALDQGNKHRGSGDSGDSG